MKFRLLVPLLALLYLLTACVAQPSTTPVTEPVTEPVTDAAAPAPVAEPAPLRIVTSFQIDSLDPVEDGFWMPEFGVAEMLMQFREDGQFHPWLLESLENTDDLTWKMTLRAGLTFQNGNPVDAAAVLACITRQMALSGVARRAVE